MRVIAVGRLKAGPERELATRYLGRFDALAPRLGLGRLETVELDESQQRHSVTRSVEEGVEIRKRLGEGTRVLVLDERGRSIASAGFAQEIGRARDAGSAAFTAVIGGPDGLADEVRDAAHLVAAFGAVTWPHQLLRVMLAEQFYRAATILAGHPYHRA